MAYLLLVLGVIAIAYIVSISVNENRGTNTCERSGNGLYSKSGAISNNRIPSKSKETIILEAKNKYNRISDKMKQKHLKDRKKYLKIFYIVFTCVFFIMGIICICVGFVAKQNKIVSIIIGSLFIAVGITLLIIMSVKLKHSDEKLILEQLRKILKKTYESLTIQKVNQYKSYVKNHSIMYKNIKELNYKYKFDRDICKTHNYYEYLNSKRQLDCFNYEKWIFQQIDQDPEFFNSFSKIYEENEKEYNEYIKEYSALKKFREEIDIEDLDLEYETFNYIEREIYNESKHPPITKPNIILEISYTSPTGRNYYSDKHQYSYYNLLEIIKDKDEQEKRIIVEKRKKELLMEQRKVKESKLRELDKLEKKLAEKEQELNKKEKEFFEATKEHIYTNEKVLINNKGTETNKNLTISQKLKLLREKFDNGEITYDEYQIKRKELM